MYGDLDLWKFDQLFSAVEIVDMECLFITIQDEGLEWNDKESITVETGTG